MRTKPDFTKKEKKKRKGRKRKKKRNEEYKQGKTEKIMNFGSGQPFHEQTGSKPCPQECARVLKQLNVSYRKTT